MILAHFVAENTHTRARAYIHTATVPGTQPFVGVAKAERNATLSRVGRPKKGPQGLAVALVVMPALAQHGLRAAVQPRLGPNAHTHADPLFNKNKTQEHIQNKRKAHRVYERLLKVVCSYYKSFRSE